MNNPTHPFIRAAVLATCVLSSAAWSDSTSSASSAASTSMGSSSTSIEKSSDSSSAKDRVAQGSYTVLAISPVALRPDVMRLEMMAVAPAAAKSVTLILPRTTVERAGLAVGLTIAAEHRPYGLALATTGSTLGAQATFFLILDEPWHRELESRPLGA